MNDLATKELRKLYHQVLKGLYRAKTIRKNTDSDIYSEFLLLNAKIRSNNKTISNLEWVLEG